MMGRKTWLSTLLAVVLTLGLTGCGSNPVNPQGTNNTAGSSPNPLSQLAAEAKKIDGMSYTMVMTTNGEKIGETKVWTFGKRVRTEIVDKGLTSIMIRDEDGTFFSTAPNLRLAHATNRDYGHKSPVDYVTLYEKNYFNGQVLNSETYQDKPCHVIRLTDPNQGELRLWIREDLGLPVKIESTNSGHLLTIEYQNLKVGPQPDQLFDLPTGTVVK